MSGPKAFVTGGSGFTGGALCAHLLSRGYEVTALARPTSDTAYLKSLGVALAPGDLRDAASLRAEQAEAKGQVFILGGARHTTLNELIAAIAAAVRSPGPRLRVPMWPVMTAARLAHFIDEAPAHVGRPT